MELLFWKTTRDATEIVDGYNAEPTNKKVSRAVWTEAEEDELRTLFMEHQTNKYPQGKLFISSISHGGVSCLHFVELDTLERRLFIRESTRFYCVTQEKFEWFTFCIFTFFSILLLLVNIFHSLSLNMHQEKYELEYEIVPLIYCNNYHVLVNL